MSLGHQLITTMVGWVRLTGQVLALTGLPSRSCFSAWRCLCPFIDQANQPAHDYTWMQHTTRVRYHPQAFKSVLGSFGEYVSLSILLWGGIQSIQAEESRDQTPPLSAASTSNGAGHITESDPVEVVSNVHTAKWRVYTDMGRDLFSKARFNEAEKYFLQAIEEAKQGFGDQDPHVASSCNNLAELYRVKGEYDKSEALFLEAVQRLSKAFNQDHESVGFTLHNLAGTYLVQRKLDQACKCYEIKEMKLGPNHPEYANTLFHLGEVLRLQGKLTEAEEHIRESIRVLEDNGTGYSQVVVRRMGRLVKILSHKGQLQEAEQLQRKILHILEISQGLESSNTTMAAENLAGTLQAVGKLTEAEELLKRSFGVRQKTLPPHHIQLGVTMFKLASVSIQRGDELASKKTEDCIAEAKVQYDIAEELLRRALRIAERSWKPNASAKGSVATGAGPLISLLRSLDALGRLQLNKSELATTPEEVEARTKEAEELFRQCLCVLDKLGFSQDIFSLPEIQRQHLACLQHLAGLLRSITTPEVKIASKDEVDRLLSKAERIKAELGRSTS